MSFFRSPVSLDAKVRIGNFADLRNELQRGDGAMLWTRQHVLRDEKTAQEFSRRVRDNLARRASKMFAPLSSLLARQAD